VLGTGNATVEAIAVGRLHDGDDPAGAFGLPYLASRDASHDTKEGTNDGWKAHLALNTPSLFHAVGDT